ncbi:hypothetical protein [Pseudodesulfovibrio methanolicus]|uniref:Uncharacterized protein n=1 Tax=Pseudodesulfovibrio methanolicus TaxID=3126690 RepID=A0ABZ2J006_9BACT
MKLEDDFKKDLRFTLGKCLDQAPVIDFIALEYWINLSFDEDARRGLLEAVVGYENDCIEAELIPSVEVNRSLKAIIKACETLEPLLDFGEFGPSARFSDKLVEYAVWYHTDPKFIRLDRNCRQNRRGELMVSDRHVAAFLKLWRKKALSSLGHKNKGGKPANIPLRNFIKALHAIYKKAGGKGIGSSRDATSEYTGDFLLLVDVLLENSSRPVPFRILGRYIEENSGLLGLNK